tara:strand:+ start:344 stop:700 length:357 start_codon:yes stop_codon:yes gene_type:complete
MVKQEEQLSLNDEELKFWRNLVGQQDYANLAIRVLVSMNADLAVIEQELSTAYYVQLTCDDCPIDVPLMVEFIEQKRGGDFIKRFFTYIRLNRPYLVAAAKEHLSKQDWTKKWVKYLR